MGAEVSSSNVITASATPLMSIRTLETNVPYTCSPNNAQVFANHQSTRSIGLSHFPMKKQAHQSSSNGFRPLGQHRILSSSASSPSFFNNHMHVAPSLPVFNSSTGIPTTNTGLLPTPPGFNNSSSSLLFIPSTVGMRHPQLAEVALTNYFRWLQQNQQQQQSNGCHNPLFSSVPAHPPHLSYPQASMYHKYVPRFLRSPHLYRTWHALYSQQVEQ